MEKNYRQINKDIHYFCLMRPIIPLFGGFGFTSSLDAEEWFECYVDEERYKVDDNYKTSDEKIYAIGDVAGVKGTVAWAAKSGKIVAEFILNSIN